MFHCRLKLCAINVLHSSSLLSKFPYSDVVKSLDFNIGGIQLFMTDEEGKVKMDSESHLGIFGSTENDNTPKFRLFLYS